MSLLVDISTQALDPGYAEAAARRAALQAARRAAQRADRAAQGQRTRAGEAADPTGDHADPTGDDPDPTAGRPGPLAALGALAAVLIIALAAHQAIVSAPSSARSRTQLVAQARAELAALSRLQGQVSKLERSVDGLRDRALASSAAGRALSAELNTQALLSGTTAVTGPGLVVRLADATGSQASTNRVLDTDLQSVVNALWAAGAEAVALNGNRLTAQSAIRTAGAAILVNFVPVSSPYRLEAVGDPVALATSFALSPAAERMRSLAQLYGLGFGYQRAGRLTLPAAPAPVLRYAHPAKVAP